MSQSGIHVALQPAPSTQLPAPPTACRRSSVHLRSHVDRRNSRQPHARSACSSTVHVSDTLVLADNSSPGIPYRSYPPPGPFRYTRARLRLTQPSSLHTGPEVCLSATLTWSPAKQVAKNKPEPAQRSETRASEPVLQAAVKCRLLPPRRRTWNVKRSLLTIPSRLWTENPRIHKGKVSRTSSKSRSRIDGCPSPMVGSFKRISLVLICALFHLLHVNQVL